MTRPRPSTRHLPAEPPAGRRLTCLAALTLVAVSACGGATSGGDAPSRPPASPDTEVALRTPRPMGSADPRAVLCQRVTDTNARLTALRAIELRLPNRVALEIELDKLQAAYGELRDTDLGEDEERLEGSLTRLGRRLGELELAVEDFRTNPRPRRAVPHVEEDAQKVADELDALTLLTRC